jgi:hypothetical protein
MIINKFNPFNPPDIRHLISESNIPYKNSGYKVKVRCLTDNKLFHSMREAERYYNAKPSTISYALKHSGWIIVNNKKLHFEYED